MATSSFSLLLLFHTFFPSESSVSLPPGILLKVYRCIHDGPSSTAISWPQPSHVNTIYASVDLSTYFTDIAVPSISIISLQYLLFVLPYPPQRCQFRLPLPTLSTLESVTRIEPSIKNPNPPNRLHSSFSSYTVHNAYSWCLSGVKQILWAASPVISAQTIHIGQEASPERCDRLELAYRVR